MKTSHISKVCLIVLSILSLSGCSSWSFFKSNDDSTDQMATTSSQAEVVVEQSTGLSLYNVKLNEETNRVSGKVRSLSRQSIIRGHIDVIVQSPSGRAIQKASTFIDSHATHRRHTPAHPHFRVALKSTIPADAKVFVSYHRDSGMSTNQTNCFNMHCE